jgi:hypothetical protein
MTLPGRIGEPQLHIPAPDGPLQSSGESGHTVCGQAGDPIEQYAGELDEEPLSGDVLRLLELHLVDDPFIKALFGHGLLVARDAQGSHRPDDGRGGVLRQGEHAVHIASSLAAVHLGRSPSARRKVRPPVGVRQPPAPRKVTGQIRRWIDGRLRGGQ